MDRASDACEVLMLNVLAQVAWERGSLSSLLSDVVAKHVIRS